MMTLRKMQTGKLTLRAAIWNWLTTMELKPSGLRFNGINLARGTKIRSAYLQFTCDEASKEETTLIVAMEDSVTPKPFSLSTHDLSSRSKTKTTVAWQPAEWKSAKESTETQRSPDLSTMIQSMVDQSGWQPGYSLVFLIQGKGKRVATASKGPTLEGPRLVIDADLFDLDEQTNAMPENRYDVRLHFAAPPLDQSGTRIFDVYAQDDLVCRDVTFDPSGTKQSRFSIQLLENVPIGNKIRLRFVPKLGRVSLAGIELIKRAQ